MNSNKKTVYMLNHALIPKSSKVVHIQKASRNSNIKGVGTINLRKNIRKIQPWNYLRGIYREDNLPRLPTLKITLISVEIKYVYPQNGIGHSGSYGYTIYNLKYSPSITY